MFEVLFSTGQVLLSKHRVYLTLHRHATQSAWLPAVKLSEHVLRLCFVEHDQEREITVFDKFQQLDELHLPSLAEVGWLLARDPADAVHQSQSRRFERSGCWYTSDHLSNR